MPNFFNANRALLVAALAGALAAVLLWNKTLLTDVPKLELSRSEIYRRAEAYAKQQGFPADNFSHVVAGSDFTGDVGHMLLYLSQRHSIEEMREKISSHKFRLESWAVRWVRDDLPQFGPQDQLTVILGFDGVVKSYDRRFPDSLSLGRIPQDSAKQIALRFLQQHHTLDTAYHLLTATTDEKPKRTSHTFVWEKKDGAYPDLIFKVEVAVSGALISRYQQTFVPPPAAVAKADRDRAGENAFQFIPQLFNFVLAVYLAIVFLKKYHEGEVGVRSGLVLFLIVLGLGLLYWLNILDVVGAGSSFGNVPRSASRWLLFAFGFIGFGTIAAIAFFGWTVGEADARTMRTERRITAMDALLHRSPFTVEVGQSIVSGVLFGVAAIGGLIIYVFLLQRYAGAWPSRVGSGSFINSFQYFNSTIGVFSTIAPVIGLWLFLQGRTAMRLKNNTVAVVLVAMIYVLYTNDGVMLIEPYWLRLLGGLILALALGFFYLRFGLLAAIVAEFSIEVISQTTPLLLSGNSNFVFIGLSDAAVLAGATLFGIVAMTRGQKFEFKGSILPAHVQRISQRARMEEELKIARDVQLSLLPHKDPSVQDFDISGICIPALEVGGDYYDYVALGQRGGVHHGSNKFALAIGDVSGKGVPAAIYMTLVKGVVQSHADFSTSPKEVLVRVNNLIYKTIKRGTFISMIYAVIDLDTRELRYARAGHNPVMMVGRATEENKIAAEAPMPRGMALGLNEGKAFETTLEEATIQLQAGDTLVLYTDGFSEAKDEDGNEFGEVQLLSVLKNHSDKPTSREIIKAICKDVSRFTGLAPQHDDMTMIVIKVK